MRLIAILSAALALPAPLLAQDSTRSLPGAKLLEWDLAKLYRNTWSAEQMLDKPVRSANGDRIGEVEDIIVGRDGRIEKIVVEVGGFIELADQHIGVPWKDVTVGENMEFVQVPLKEAQDGTYSLFGNVPLGEDVAARDSAWRVNELIGDYASLWDVPRYGIVSDVLFQDSGKAAALVVSRAARWGGYGLFAYPYLGYYPDSRAYPLPYKSDEVVRLQSFDYAQLGSGAATGATRQSETALTVKQSEAHGAYLADAQGRALYLLEADPKGKSECADACARVWPPLLVPQGKPQAKDEAVQEKLISTIERPDGSRQVAYNGHPLYYYVKDRGAGQASGQDVHDQWGEWYLVTPKGTKAGEADKPS